MRRFDTHILRPSANIAASSTFRLSSHSLLASGSHNFRAASAEAHTTPTARVLRSQLTGSFGVQQYPAPHPPLSTQAALLSHPVSYVYKRHFPRRRLQSSVYPLSIGSTILVVSALLYFLCPFSIYRPKHLTSNSASTQPPLQPCTNSDNLLQDIDANMSSTTLSPGRVGNLTAEQEEKLKKMWAALYHILDVAKDIEAASSDSASAADSAAATKDVEKDKSKKRSLFGRKSKDVPDATVSAAPSETDDKYGQTKHFQETLQKESPEVLRNTLWSMIKHDDPDSLLLRFLRARKWDVEKALVMLISTVNWRNSEMQLDNDIILKGESGALDDSLNGTGVTKTTGTGMIEQLRMGKAYFHGCDKESRPLCFVRVRLHHQGDQTDAAQERNTVFLIETARYMLQAPVETATIVFDMTGFSISNMDYTPIKFMVKCFEANYPECLGAILVYKAPWVFQGFWKIIRGWLDPVVANKIHFVNNAKDLTAFIPETQIPKELDGLEDWEYKYVEPVTGENDLMQDTSSRDKLQAERDVLYKEYEQATVQWVKGDSNASALRQELRGKLRHNYWALDPYIRARSMYDRIGVLNPGGKVDFYPGGIPKGASK